MKRGFVIRALIVFLLLMAIAVIAVAIAMDTIVTSRVSSVASFHELKGIQDADTTKNVAVRNQVKKAGKDKEAKELDEIRGAKVRHFQVISGAQNVQNKYYETQEKGGDAESLRADLLQRIPDARSALAEMKTLTGREIEILQAVGSDKPAIEVARQFYKAMETIVSSLQVEELSDAQVEARMNDVQVSGRNAVANANRLAQKFSPDSLDNEEKNTLEQEVVIPGEENAKGMGAVLSQMPSVIFGSVAGISEGLRLFGQARERYGNNFDAMAHDLVYKQGMFTRNNMNAFQKRLDSYGSGAQRFLAEYSPFIKTVGSGIGRGSNVNPLGYGSNVVVRFVDPEMSSYIVDEDENLHWRIIVDRGVTKWDDRGENVRPLVAFDYDDSAVETIVKMMSAVAPGYEDYIRKSRLVYVYKSYDLRTLKSYVLEMSFQTAQGQEIYFFKFPDPYVDPRVVRKRTLDYSILETISVVSPPKDKRTVTKMFGGSEPARQDSGEPKDGGKKQDVKPAKPGTDESAKSDKAPKVSRKGSIMLPPEGSEALEALGGDKASTGALIEQHDKAVKYYEEGNFPMALRVFTRAVNMLEGNYLDAYWAALSAHNAKNPGAAKEWLDKCLAIKKDYIPALEMKKALKIK